MIDFFLSVVLNKYFLLFFITQGVAALVLIHRALAKCEPLRKTKLSVPGKILLITPQLSNEKMPNLGT